MSKYKIEIEIDVDFDAIFAEIPEGLFSPENKGSDEGYEIECIHDVLREVLIVQLERKMKYLKDPDYKYLKHHNECSIAVAKEITENMKITKQR